MDWQAIGGFVGGIGNYLGQKEANSANRMMNNTNNAWSEAMSNTAHQREVTDLKAAGLNPILSAGGGGAGTPSPSSIQQQPASIDFPGIMNVWSQKKQAEQTDAKIAQDAQRVKNETAATAAGIVKNLSGAELDRVNALESKGGILTKTLGTDVFEKTKDKMVPMPKLPDAPKFRKNQNGLPLNLR